MEKLSLKDKLLKLNACEATLAPYMCCLRESQVSQKLKSNKVHQ